jgi:hypothetical protein
MNIFGNISQIVINMGAESSTEKEATDINGVGGEISALNGKTPAIASFKGSLYVAFKDHTGLVYIGCASDGVTWKHVKYVGSVTSDSPSFAVHDGYLYLAYRNGGSGIFVVRTEDGINFKDTRSITATA